MKPILTYLCVILISASAASQQANTSSASRQNWDPFLDTLQRRTIQWFLDVTPQSTGLTPDRWPAEWSPSSIASVGFALTTYPVAVERKMITRAEAISRTLTTLRFLWRLPQSEKAVATAGYKGFYYHFLKKDTGMREWNCELSTIDTGLLLAGVLFAQSYFDHNAPGEKEIRALADSLYRRVDWQWAMGKSKGVLMGWKPEEGFHSWTWFGYTEAMILYTLALGSPTHPVPPSAWDVWTERYLWKEYYGQTLVNFMALFGHQYSHTWIDYRGIKDAYMREKGIDYFENTRRAAYVHRTYATKNPHRLLDYSDSIWGLTACDGPKDTTFVVAGRERKFRSYSARGTGAEEEVDDGTIAPTGAAACIPFAPEIAIPAVKAMRNKYGENLWTKYGFVDAFNPTYITPLTPQGWFDKDYLGIDQGPIALMIENYRNGFVWEVMKKNPYIVRGLKRAGFTGGWLARTTVE
ncbi:MAG: Tat pathway signal protein [Ignavibacteriales bacterium]|nr:Tat pathway signal protein [Ignavibacteriales bacterium]